MPLSAKREVPHSGMGCETRWAGGAAGSSIGSRLREESVTHPVGWASLSRPVKAYRVFHATWSVAGLASLGYIWICATTRRRDRRLGACIAFLSIEGAGLIVGGGDCPMGPLQERMGDPVPFFELVLPPRAAKAAVPILAVASLAGLLAVALRQPSRSSQAAT